MREPSFLLGVPSSYSSPNISHICCGFLLRDMLRGGYTFHSMIKHSSVRTSLMYHRCRIDKENILHLCTYHTMGKSMALHHPKHAAVMYDFWRTFLDCRSLCIATPSYGKMWLSDLCNWALLILLHWRIGERDRRWGSLRILVGHRLLWKHCLWICYLILDWCFGLLRLRNHILGCSLIFELLNQYPFLDVLAQRLYVVSHSSTPQPMDNATWTTPIHMWMGKQEC